MANRTYLKIRGLFKRFPARKVLDGLDLEVREGEFLAIVGKSGCGKSTLLRLIAGLDFPDRGELRVEDKIVTGLNPEIRLMFQDARLLPWKRVLANVALGLQGPRSERRDKATKALEQVGLADREKDWPAILSGGQRQRVALARALVHSPQLLLLDEPLGALDALTRIEMQQLIEDLWSRRGFTSILITHEVEEALVLADRVLVLEGGRSTLEVEVDLPRPRDRSAPEFVALKTRVLDTILDSQAAASLNAPKAGRFPETPPDSLVIPREQLLRDESPLATFA